MKKFLPFTIACLTIALVGVITAPESLTRPEGAPAASAGVPSDNNRTCATSGCHSGVAQDRDGIITSNVPSSGYLPGETYTITITLTEQGISKWGFQASAQNNSGTLLGTYTITDAANTQLASGATGAKYVTHTSAGNSGSTNSKTWSFDWTAPAAGTGTVNFYAAAMAANGTGSTAGDLVYKDVLPLTEDQSASVANMNTSNEFTVYPNPASGDFITVTGIRGNGVSEVFIYNAIGNVVKKEKLSVNQREISIDKLPAGVYYLWLNENGKQSMKRFVRQ